MKKLVIGIVVVALLLALGAVVVPPLVPFDSWKPEIVRRVKDATGRNLRIDGAMRLSVFPRIELALDDVGFSNAPGAAAPEMATLERLRLALNLRPLLSGRIEVASLVLDRPVIELEIDAQGRPNWRFEGAPASPATDDPSVSMSGLRLDEVRIEGGQVSWTDRRGGAVQKAGEVNLRFALPDLDRPLAAEGSLAWRERQVKLAVTIANPRALVDGGSTAATGRIESDALSLRLDRAEAGFAPPRLDGNVDLAVPSVRGLAAWIGTPVAASGSTFGALRIRGNMKLDAKRFDFRDAAVEIDATRATGRVTVDFSSTRPGIEAVLASDRLDLDPYFPPAPAGAAQAAQGWNAQPIAFDRLQVADAKLDLDLGSVEVREFRLGKSMAHAQLKQGRLVVDVPTLALYDGKGSGKLTIDAAQPESSRLELVLDVEGCRVEPLLVAATGSDRLSGIGTLRLDVGSRGRSMRELVGALRGKSRVDLREGAIRGINLVGMVTHMAGSFERSEAARTDFSGMSGSFTIAGGIARTDDLSLESPLLHVEGKGTIDLPQKALDLRISPKFVAPLVGQLGLGSPGVAVPVLISGPWSHPRYVPDLAGMIRGGLEVPVDVLRGVVEMPGNLIGGKKKAPPPGDQPPPARSRSLRDLFGR